MLLDLEEYQQLIRLSLPDAELLVGLSAGELQALAHSAPWHLRSKIRLDDLLARNADGQLSETDQVALDPMGTALPHT